MEGRAPEAQVEVTWLLSLIRFSGSFRDWAFHYRLRAAWFNLMDSGQEEKGENQGLDPEDEEDFYKEETGVPGKGTGTDESLLAETEEEAAQKPQEQVPAIEKVREEAPELTEDLEESGPVETMDEVPKKTGIEQPSRDEALKKDDAARKSRETTPGSEEVPQETLADRLYNRADQILESLEARIDFLDQKKQQVDEILETFPPEQYYPIVRDTVCRLIRHIIPQKMEGMVHYGFGEAYTTGKVCSWAACFYPLYAGSLDLVPDFGRKVLEGNLEGRGRIRLGYFVRLLIGLLLKKEVRFVICYLLKSRKKPRQSTKSPAKERI